MTSCNMEERVARAISAAAYDYMRSIGFSGGWDHDELGRTIARAAIATINSTPDSGLVTERLCDLHKRMSFCFEGATGKPPPRRPHVFEPQWADLETLLDAAVALRSTSPTPDSNALREALGSCRVKLLGHPSIGDVLACLNIIDAALLSSDPGRVE